MYHLTRPALFQVPLQHSFRGRVTEGNEEPADNHPSKPLVCQARYSHGQLWLLTLFPDPDAVILPRPVSPAFPTRIDPLQDDLKDPRPYRPGWEWEGYIPLKRPDGRQAPLWILEDTPIPTDVENIPSAKGIGYRVSESSREAAWETMESLSDAWRMTREDRGSEQNRPDLPIPLDATLYPSEAEVVNRIRVFRQQSVRCAGYLTMALLRSADEDRKISFMRSSTDWLANALICGTIRRGWTIDPLRLSTLELIQLAVWRKHDVPFAYLWSREHAKVPRLYILDPNHHKSKVRLSDAGGEDARQTYLIAERYGDCWGRRIEKDDLPVLHFEYRYEDYYDSFLHLNTRVYFKDQPIGKDFATIEAREEPVSPFEADKPNEVPDPDSEFFGSAKPFCITSTIHRSPVEKATQLPGARLAASEFEERMLVGQLWSAANSNEGELRLQLWESHSAHVVERSWFATEDNAEFPLDSRDLSYKNNFVQQSVITFPPSTELRFLLYTLLLPKAARVELWDLALRTGMPFRPQFTENYGRRTYDQDKDLMLEALRSQPRGWTKEQTEEEGLLVAPSRGRVSRYRDLYRVSTERMVLHPRLPTLLFYGGLTWRLAVKYGGAETVREATKGPSASYVLFGTIASRDPEKETNSEVHASPNHDNLVSLLHGLFEDGRSMWPSADIFGASWRWRGQWTKENEAWFRSIDEAITAGRWKPLDEHGWIAELGRPPKCMREAGKAEPIDVQVRGMVEALRAAGLHMDTIMKEQGGVDWNHTHDLD